MSFTWHHQTPKLHSCNCGSNCKCHRTSAANSEFSSVIGFQPTKVLPQYTAPPLPSMAASGWLKSLQDIGTVLPCWVWRDLVLSKPRTWINHTLQHVHFSLHRPIGLLLPHWELDPCSPRQNHTCDTSSLLISGLQKVYISLSQTTENQHFSLVQYLGH